ncbi:protein archease [Candidatus Pacearchaeota archaeon CG_4_9_14_3_um_filter_31_7]|nr:MAG: hypothetical protein AUJ10_00235 [Candidatus Pacearchaeota archaeon CG1_02_31_27]PIN92243.1 MAG: protein archease [Candidatus Pacearchaeota archaeon CG10_big_fil_rev_8_21_14_0_10_31_59]PJA70483.1 MAG: protein archease [Candidatus Pacearchaeota archaeon CG_4_9_14_3_um_filter_31_7]
MVTRKFEFLEHTADIKFRAYGSDLNEIFENSAYALKEVMVGGKVKGKNKKKFLIINPVSLRIDLKRLLYSFLEKFLILIDTEGQILAEIKKIKIDEKNGRLEAVFLTDNIKNYNTMTDVKAVTYNDMIVSKEKKFAQVVVDV